MHTFRSPRLASVAARVGHGAAAPDHTAHVLHPGDVACGGRGERFETLLGSCVAVVLTDPYRTAAAICHIVYPGAGERPGDTAHADAALAEMWARLHARGFSPQLCEAYVYGGGNMFPRIYPGGAIGAHTTQRVLDALAHAGVRLLHLDVGGRSYRRLAWTIGPGAPTVTAVEI